MTLLLPESLISQASVVCNRSFSGCVFPPHSSGSLYTALCQEADYMKAADHQYVPMVYGMYEGPVPAMGPDVRQGIVMELMEEGSLQSFLYGYEAQILAK